MPLLIKDVPCSGEPSFEKAEDNKSYTGPSKGSCRSGLPGFEVEGISNSEMKIRNHHAGMVGGRGSRR